MNLVDLKNLIASEPANTARTDEEVFAWLHEKSLPGKITSAEIADVIFTSGSYSDIVLASQDVGSSAKKKAAIVALAILNVRDRELDYARSEVTSSLSGVLGELENSNLISTEIKNKILNLGNNKLSPKEKARFPEFKLKHVTEARGMS